MLDYTKGELIGSIGITSVAVILLLLGVAKFFEIIF